MRVLILLLALSIPVAAQNVPVLQNPTATQNVVQPSGTSLNVNTLNAQYLNGTIQADQFPGSDMCAKIAYILSNTIVPAGGGDIDATHFSGVQPCSEDPFSTVIPPTWGGNLSVRFGHVKIQTVKPWVITNVKITLSGISPMATQLVYTGATAANAVLTVTSYNGNCADVRIENLYLLGDGNGTNRSNWANTGLLALDCFRSQFDNIWAWGTQNFGIYIQGGVDVELRKPRISEFDANEVLGTAIGAPQSAGIQLDAYTSGGQTYSTTAGTISDIAVEGVPGTGIICSNAGHIVFVGGTSENNGKGVYVGPNCTDMTFIGMDLEANSQNVDFQDAGSNTTLVNVYTQNPTQLIGSSDNSSTSGFCQGPACWSTGSSAPSGSCNKGSMYTRTDTGDLYICKASGWVLK